MNLTQYNKWYSGFVYDVLFPAVKKATHINTHLAKNAQLQKELEVNKNMLVIVNLVAIIEANFLDSTQRKNIRKFEVLSTPLNHQINETHLSCFYYLRDAYAHHGEPMLFPPSSNTTCFQSAVANSAFPFATISGNSICINKNSVHELNLIAVKLFGGVT